VGDQDHQQRGADLALKNHPCLCLTSSTVQRLFPSAFEVLCLVIGRHLLCTHGVPLRHALCSCLESRPGPPSDVTSRTLLKVTGNVRTNLPFRRNAPACCSRTMPQISPLRALGPCHLGSQLARVQERCRTRADRMEIFPHAKATQPRSRKMQVSRQPSPAKLSAGGTGRHGHFSLTAHAPGGAGAVTLTTNLHTICTYSPARLHRLTLSCAGAKTRSSRCSGNLS
jgi:hypothetical protein